MTKIINSLVEIANRYDALFCDLWGCVHDGLIPFPEALNAMQSFKAKGGRVILVTNAPRPHSDVRKQLYDIGVKEDIYDGIATSGDSARMALFTGALGKSVYFIGQPHDQSFFNPMNVVLDLSLIHI